VATKSGDIPHGSDEELSPDELRLTYGFVSVIAGTSMHRSESSPRLRCSARVRTWRVLHSVSEAGDARTFADGLPRDRKARTQLANLRGWPPMGLI